MVAWFSRDNVSFRLVDSLDRWSTLLPEFIDLVMSDRWVKRIRQLVDEAKRSPFAAKIVEDYHWLELELAQQQFILDNEGDLRPQLIGPDTAAALMFAANAVEVYRGLPSTGRKALNGRLRDALNTNFAGLFLELDVAHTLLQADYEVSFPDFEGAEQFDLSFRRGSSEMALECKSISVDAGRKIHRRNFYRFMISLQDVIVERAHSDQCIVIATLEDRLPTDDMGQKELRDAVLAALQAPQRNAARGTFFDIHREPWGHQLEDAITSVSGDLLKACQNIYGENCHAAGIVTEEFGCLVVVRSKREDDPSKVQLEAIKTAARQLPNGLAGFIAVQ
jgi:hypothetical protein